MFPFEAPPLALIVDPSHILPPAIEKHLARPYKALRKRIPQVDVCFCFVQLQQGYSIEEFAFWLFNKAPGANKSRPWNLLVTVDLFSEQLNLTSGYALEPFLIHESWEASLQQLAACLRDGKYYQGLAGFLRDSRVLLAAACRAAQKDARAGQNTQSGVAAISDDCRGVTSPEQRLCVSRQQNKHHDPGKEPVPTGP